MSMPFPHVMLTIAFVGLTAAAAAAQDAIVMPPSHVRPTTQDGRALLDDLVDRSPTGRALVDRLEQSDVVVYVRFASFGTELLDGRIAIVRSRWQQRILIVELACARLRLAQLVTLAHELHHAVEIADAPAVVDAPTLAAYYARIGVHTGRILESETFETRAAAEAGRRVHRELTGGGTRTAQ